MKTYIRFKQHKNRLKNMKIESQQVAKLQYFLLRPYFSIAVCLTSYFVGVHILQLINFTRVCNRIADLNARNKCLTAKLLQQDYRYHKLRKTFSKFYRRHYELIFKFNIGLKTLLREGVSEPESYGDLVDKFKKLIGRNDFFFQFRNIITRY